MYLDYIRSKKEINENQISQTVGIYKNNIKLIMII